MSKEKGMVFTAESVQAILGGTKSQTRRVVTPHPILAKIENVVISNHKGYCPYTQKRFIKREYAIGDIIWVRETWRYCDDLQGFCYKASPHEADNCRKFASVCERIPKWRSPRYMPKEAARIFLRVTDVRVERLQQISEADAIAEGMESVEAYRKHWNEVNGKREKGAYKWENDPFVWMYSFEMVGEQDAD